MELLFEFIGEILIEGLVEIVKNKKISLWLRIPLFLIISIGYLGLLALMIVLCVKSFLDNLLLGIILLVLSLVLLFIYIVFIYKLRKGTLK